MDQDLAEKLRELRHLMENATEEDRHKLPEMTRWFDGYLARATPAQSLELRRAVRRLWPVGVMVLIEEAGAADPEVSMGARLALEKIGTLRKGGAN